MRRHILVLAALLILVACQGPAGPPGPAGQQGPSGVAPANYDEVSANLADDVNFRVSLANLLTAQYANELRGETGAAGVCDCEGGGGGRQWVLRDRNGEVFDGEISPRYEGWGDFGEPVIDCVGVGLAEGRYIGLSYELQSGSPLPCTIPFDPEITGIWADFECSGQLFTSLHTSAALRGHQIVGAHRTDVYYISVNSPLDNLQFYFKKDDSGECIRVDPEPPGLPVRVLSKVPQGIMNLLPSPPYSVSR